jgi:hypothetical protein
MEQQRFSQEQIDPSASFHQQYSQAQPGPVFAQPLPLQQVGVAVQPIYQVAPVQPIVPGTSQPTSAHASASLALGLLTPPLLFLTLIAGIRASSSPSWLSFVLTDVLALVCALLAIVLGHFALHAIHHSGGRLKGSGLAVTGLCIGYLSLLPVLLFLLVASAIRW